jgi:hypothetical protein
MSHAQRWCEPCSSEERDSPDRFALAHCQALESLRGDLENSPLIRR